MTVQEAAHQLTVSSATVYQLVKANRIRHRRVTIGESKRTRITISREAIRDYLVTVTRGPCDRRATEEGQPA